MNRKLPLLLVALLSGAACAGTVNPAGPVIYFDSFESPQKCWVSGSDTREKSVRPDTSARKLEPSKDKKWASTTLKLATLNVKMLNGVAPNSVFVGFWIYGPDVKAAKVEFNGKDFNFADSIEVPKDKWTEVIINLSQATANKKRPEKDFELREIKLVATFHGTSNPVAFVDDFIFTLGANPKAVWPSAIAADAQHASKFAALAHDGYEYTEEIDGKLREAMKGVRRAPTRNALVVASEKNSAALVDAGRKAGLKRTYASPELPEGIALNSPSDVRLYLPLAMKKPDPDYVLFALPAKVYMGVSSSEMDLWCKRVLALGAVPIWVIPSMPSGSKAEDIKRHEDSTKRLLKDFARLGIPHVDARFALAKIPDAYEGEEYKPAAITAIAKLIDEAVQHVEKNKPR